MICPICVVDGVTIAACRLFGIPDVITVYLLGILTMSFALATNRVLTKSTKWKTVPYQLLLITALYSIITVWTLDVMGVI